MKNIKTLKVDKKVNHTKFKVEKMETNLTTRECVSRFAAFLDDGDVLRVKGTRQDSFTPGVTFIGTVFSPGDRLPVVHFEADSGEQRQVLLRDVRRWLRDGTLELQKT